jgi:VIT1/CCC1 family predicted Fe2+/Mn2+ transporter
MATAMARNPEFMADLMMQYETGMSDPSGDAPIARGMMTFVSFIVFGLAPLLPYFLLDPVPSTFMVSVFATFAALVALGSLRWQVTTTTLARCVGESVLVGGTCAAVAYAVGVAFRM